MNITWDPLQTSQPAWRHRWRIFWLLVSPTPTAPRSLHLTVQYASPKRTRTHIHTQAQDESKFPRVTLSKIFKLLQVLSPSLPHHGLPWSSQGILSGLPLLAASHLIGPLHGNHQWLAPQRPTWCVWMYWKGCKATNVKCFPNVFLFLFNCALLNPKYSTGINNVSS